MTSVDSINWHASLSTAVVNEQETTFHQRNNSIEFVPMNEVSDDSDNDLFEGKYTKEDDVFGITPKGKTKLLGGYDTSATARNAATSPKIPTSTSSASRPKPVKQTLQAYPTQSTSGKTTFGSKAMSKLNALLGRSKPWTENDPPASLFSIEGHANFFASLDETVLVDHQSLLI